MRRVWVPVLIVLLLSGCGADQSPKGDSAGGEALSRLRLPDGFEIHAELLTTPVQQQIGMMYRTKLDHDAGMLFVYPVPQAMPFWMHNVNLPLDIVFIGSDRKVVELVENAEPCLGESGKCPTYGGRVGAQFVLEINGGDAAKHGVRLGTTISF